MRLGCSNDFLRFIQLETARAKTWHLTSGLQLFLPDHRPEYMQILGTAKTFQKLYFFYVAVQYLFLLDLCHGYIMNTSYMIANYRTQFHLYTAVYHKSSKLTLQKVFSNYQDYNFNNNNKKLQLPSSNLICMDH